MGKSSPTTAAFAVLLGAIVGFLALFLREMGWFLGVMALFGLSGYYVRIGRLTDVGWLLLAAGLTPGLILGRNGITAVLDPSVEVGVDTWVLLMVAVTIAAAGGLVLYAAGHRQAKA